MAVLMTYHKLIEREEKNVDWFWKYGTIFVLTLTIICCMTTSFSFHKILYSFDDYCILNAEVSFKEAEQSTEMVAIAEASSTNLDDRSEEFPNKLQRIYENNPKINVREKKFLESQMIDVTFTSWGDRKLCDWAIYLPIFEWCFGLIFLTFFCLCGKGGKTEDESFLTQPWRIVGPALCFFLFMFIITIVRISFVHPSMANFCNNLTLPTPNVGCFSAMNVYQIRSTNYYPSIFYGLFLSVDYIILLLWLSLAIIMLLRIIFVVDFQLIRVIIRTCEHESTHEKTIFKVVEKQTTENDSNLKSDVKYGKIQEDEVEEKISFSL